MATEKKFITLRGMLEELKGKVDETYAARIETAVSMKSVDRLEEEAIKKLDTIDAVIRLAESYYPLQFDTDLVLIQFRLESLEVNNAD
jgi:hypothetical protein